MPVVALAAVVVALELGGDPARELLRYEREALADGELWRLLTAHLVHLGWAHAAWNAAGLLLTWWLVGGLLSEADWLGVALAAALAIDIGLYFLAPDVGWYVGLSGVLHGWLAAGALAMLRAHPALGGLLAAGLAAKLLWEQAMGPLQLSESGAGGPVIAGAHLYGAAGGAAYRLLRIAVPRRRRRSL